MKVVNYTDLRNNLTSHLDFVVNDVEEVIVKRKGDADVVLVPLDEYQALKETCYLLSGKNRDLLLNSIAQIEKGKTFKKDIK